MFATATTCSLLHNWDSTPPGELCLWRQHCLLNSLQHGSRGFVLLQERQPFSVGELRLQRFHCLLDSLEREVRTTGVSRLSGDETEPNMIRVPQLSTCYAGGDRSTKSHVW